MKLLTPNETRLSLDNCVLTDTRYINKTSPDGSYYFSFEAMRPSDCYRLDEALEQAVKKIEFNTQDPDVTPSTDVLDKKSNYQVSQLQAPRFSFDYQDHIDLQGQTVSLVLHLRDDRNGCVRLSCDWINLNAEN